jgi:hypothetical protein
MTASMFHVTNLISPGVSTLPADRQPPRSPFSHPLTPGAAADVSMRDSMIADMNDSMIADDDDAVEDDADADDDDDDDTTTPARQSQPTPTPDAYGGTVHDESSVPTAA